ncbi:MAG: hypothetical protein ACM37W_09840 [Actinomycetota bacterium]
MDALVYRFRGGNLYWLWSARRRPQPPCQKERILLGTLPTRIVS